MFHRKVKNSWGDTWGQQGYILLERSDSEEDDGGECGLLIEATYPILEPIPTLDDAEFAVEAIALKVVERAEDFESSATANDCGGGTSDVVFDDGEEEGWWLCFALIRSGETCGCSQSRPIYSSSSSSGRTTFSMI